MELYSADVNARPDGRVNRTPAGDELDESMSDAHGLSIYEEVNANTS